MKTLAIKKNDMVVVLSGEEKGKIGRVLAAYPEKRRVLVEGVNVISKALRKSQDNPKGGIITKEAPIHISKVMKQERHEARKKKHGTAPATAEA
ncbi:MAG TPA: 50S ribosomal protein L24 [Verrucomicrobiae bacterium]|nr:50S ribosomal protein L24 [Verrucomicrobiae bacterium]